MTLLVEIGDILDLAPVLLPRTEAIRLQNPNPALSVMRPTNARPVFDDVVVELSDGGED